MKKQLAQLDEFNKKFGTFVSDKPSCDTVPLDVVNLRVRLIQEELDEYKKAALLDDLTGVADALSDLLYVLLGTVYAHGLQSHYEALFDEVHASNMSKSPVGRDGKATKEQGYFKPDLIKVLERVNREVEEVA